MMSVPLAPISLGRFIGAYLRLIPMSDIPQFNPPLMHSMHASSADEDAEKASNALSQNGEFTVRMGFVNREYETSTFGIPDSL